MLGQTQLIVAGIAAVLVALLAVQTARVGKFKAEAQAATDTANGLVVAVESKDGLIGRLHTANERLAAEAQRQLDAANAAGKSIEIFQAKLAVARKALKAAEDADRALPECQVLLATDIGALCPGHAVSMRERAEGRLP